MAESGVGGIRMFDDFIGFNIPVAGTLTSLLDPIFTPGGWQLVGEGLNEADSGAIGLSADGLNGVVRLTTTDETVHSAGFQTNSGFDMGLNGGIMLEARVRMAALTAKNAFFGISDVRTAGLQVLEGEIISGDTATLTLTASDLCGFYYCTDLTDTADWHGVYNGGTTTGPTASTSVDLDAGAVAGEFQILKLTISDAGTARWYVDGVLKQTVVGAVSTSVDMNALIMVEADSAAVASLDVDYLLLESNRDWTV